MVYFLSKIVMESLNFGKEIEESLKVEEIIMKTHSAEENSY